MTVYKCDWPGHSWPIGHYWILGCLLQSTLVGLKSSQSQKLVIVFFGDIHKNHRENNHSSSNSSKCRSFFHNQRCWGRAPDIQEGDDGGVHWTLRPLPQLVSCCLNLSNFLVRFSNVNLQSVFRLEGVSTLVRFSFHICEVSFPSTFLHQAATVKYMLIQFSAMLPHPKPISRSARTSWNTFVS